MQQEEYHEANTKDKLYHLMVRNSYYLPKSSSTIITKKWLE